MAGMIFNLNLPMEPVNTAVNYVPKSSDGIKIELGHRFDTLASKWPITVWNDYTAIALKLSKWSEVKPILQILNDIVERYLKDAKKGNYIDNFLTKVLTFYERRHNFPGSFTVLSGFAGEDDMKAKVIQAGYHFKDGVSFAHGEFSHRFQWFVVMWLKDKTNTLNNEVRKLYKESALASRSGKYTLWDYCVDCFGRDENYTYTYANIPGVDGDNCRSPSVLNSKILGDPDMASLAFILTNKVKQTKWHASGTLVSTVSRAKHVEDWADDKNVTATATQSRLGLYREASVVRRGDTMIAKNIYGHPVNKISALAGDDAIKPYLPDPVI